MRKNEGDYTSGGTGRSLEVFGVDVCNAKKQHSFLQLSPSPPHLKPLSPPLHQPLHFPHIALEEAVDFHSTAVSVEGDGGEAGDGGVDHHTRHRFVGDKVGVVPIYRLIR